MKIDRFRSVRDILRMITATLKSELQEIADHLPDTASYSDAMYKLYIHMKVAKGRQAAREGRFVSDGSGA